MGLDWMVNHIVKDGKDDQFNFATSKLDEIEEDLGGVWTTFKKDNLPRFVGREAPGENATQEEITEWEKDCMPFTCMFPNPLQDEFFETDSFKTLDAKREEWRKTYNLCIITPMDTIGAPRIGFDDAADEWAKANWAEVSQTATGSRSDSARAGRLAGLDGGR